MSLLKRSACCLPPWETVALLLPDPGTSNSSLCTLTPEPKRRVHACLLGGRAELGHREII